MLNKSGNQKTTCQEAIKCYYKAGRVCNFRKNVRAMLSVLQEEYHRDSECIVNLADTYNLPCKGLDNKGRERAIGDVLTGKELRK